MTKRTNKGRRIYNIVLKHWKATVGSLVILASVFLLILKKIEVETLAAIVAALLAAGFLPKAQDNDTN
jgi:dolichyl-phosphate-mannose--protein O-mannosyl transferase